MNIEEVAINNPNKSYYLQKLDFNSDKISDEGLLKKVIKIFNLTKDPSKNKSYFIN